MEAFDISTFLASEESVSNISSSAHRCFVLLKSCGNVAYCKADHWAENKLAEFRLWTATSGVFAGEKASLDSRLALQPEIKDVILSLLEVLSESLLQCQYHGQEIPAADTDVDDQSSTSDAEVEDDTHATTLLLPTSSEIPPRAFSPWSDDSSATHSDVLSDSEEISSVVNPMFYRAKGEIDQTIDHLVRLSLAIRKAGTTSRRHKADKRFRWEDHEAFHRHLNIVVLARGSEDGRTDYEMDTKKLSLVQMRLIKANLRRRNRFLYAQRHSIKLATDAALQDGQKDLQVRTDWPTFMEDNQQMGETVSVGETMSLALTDSEEPQRFPYPVNVDLYQEPGQPVLTATSASAATQAIDISHIHPVDSSRVAKTNITATTAKITYPQPPAAVDGVRYFKCPCCCQSLPDMYRQPSLWKKHLMADICPYTCVIEDCPTPDNLYGTRSEWSKHVRQDHQQCWKCPSCSIIGQAPLIFPSIEAFLDHLREVHMATIKEEQYSTLIPEAAMPVPAGISCCPLCESTGPADCDPLMDHIAEHLHSFALRSLPWAPTDVATGDAEDRSLAEEDDDNGYFFLNAYFEQDSNQDSGQYNLTNGSDRDSEGMPSLHSSEGSDRSQNLSDGDLEEETPLEFKEISMENEDISIPAFGSRYGSAYNPHSDGAKFDEDRNIPLELYLPNNFPEVVSGPVVMPSVKPILDIRLLDQLRSLYHRANAAHFYRDKFPHLFEDKAPKLVFDDTLPEVMEGSWPKVYPSTYRPEYVEEWQQLLEHMSDKYLLGLGRQRAPARKNVQHGQPKTSLRSQIRDLQKEGKISEALERTIQLSYVLEFEVGFFHPARIEVTQEVVRTLKNQDNWERAKSVLKQESVKALFITEDRDLFSYEDQIEATQLYLAMFQEFDLTDETIQMKLLELAIRLKEDGVELDGMRHSLFQTANFFRQMGQDALSKELIELHNWFFQSPLSKTSKMVAIPEIEKWSSNLTQVLSEWVDRLGLRQADKPSKISRLSRLWRRE